MSVINANPLMLGDAGYNIGRSLRFRSSASAYLNRTFTTPTSGTTFTWSGWVKLGVISTANFLFAATTASPASKNDWSHMWFESTGDLAIGDYNNYVLQTNAAYRDPSAWYHVVMAFDTTQATAANRIKLYVNGSQITYTQGASFPTQNEVTAFGRAIEHRIGRNSNNASGYLDAYLAEVNFIDGQALTPSSFGQTDPVTGVWTPKKYTGTYGANGFYLPFSDNTSATTLAYDKSGNGNNWTPNNISTTAGATYDSMTDVPTLTSATAANYSVLNPLHYLALGSALSNGNLTGTGINGATSPYWRSYPSTINVSSGKWYCELVVGTINNGHSLGIASAFNSSGIRSTYYEYNFYDQYYEVSGTPTAYGVRATTGQIIGMAVDLDAGTIEWFVNGSSQGQKTGVAAGSYFLTYSLGWGNGAAQTGSINFGQRPFSYTPPTGFKALNTFNLPDPTIKKPNQYMDVKVRTGAGAASSVTGIGFQPDFVWVKDRTAAQTHGLFDSVRGVQNLLQSNATAAELTSSGYLTAFNSDGYSFGSGTQFLNANTDNYVDWQWKKGATPGFDIVTYTGSGSAGQVVNQSLGVAPSMIICKCRSNTGNWIGYHKSLGFNQYFYLNQTVAAQSATPTWATSSTTFTMQQNFDDYNSTGRTYVAYLFAEIPGFSKFGSYTGNGSADGPFVYCGFRPKYILTKRTDSTSNWVVQDTSCSPYNVVNDSLMPNLSVATQAGPWFDILSNGFKVRNNGSDTNTSGGTYIYMCFAESPFKTSLAR